MCISDIVVPVLFIVSATSEHRVHLEMSLLALVCVSTTRGSLTYIGSYISGAKSAIQTLLENRQFSSGT